LFAPRESFERVLSPLTKLCARLNRLGKRATQPTPEQTLPQHTAKFANSPMLQPLRAAMKSRGSGNAADDEERKKDSDFVWTFFFFTRTSDLVHSSAGARFCVRKGALVGHGYSKGCCFKALQLNVRCIRHL